MKLESLAETFLNALESSAEKVPFGIRWICFTVKKLAVVCKYLIINNHNDCTRTA